MIYLDENIDEHPKFVGLPGEACWAWVRMLAYCRRHRTDGWVPEEVAKARAGGGQRARSVLDKLTTPSPSAPDKAPLLSKQGARYLLHDYLAWNKSRSQIDEESAEKSRLGRLGAEARAKRAAKQDAKRSAEEEFKPRSPIPDPRSPIPLQKRNPYSPLRGLALTRRQSSIEILGD